MIGRDIIRYFTGLFSYGFISNSSDGIIGNQLGENQGNLSVIPPPHSTNYPVEETRQDSLIDDRPPKAISTPLHSPPS